MDRSGLLGTKCCLLACLLARLLSCSLLSCCLLSCCLLGGLLGGCLSLLISLCLLRCHGLLLRRLGCERRFCGRSSVAGFG